MTLVLLLRCSDTCDYYSLAGIVIDVEGCCTGTSEVIAASLNFEVAFIATALQILVLDLRKKSPNFWGLQSVEAMPP